MIPGIVFIALPSKEVDTALYWVHDQHVVRSRDKPNWKQLATSAGRYHILNFDTDTKYFCAGIDRYRYRYQSQGQPPSLMTIIFVQGSNMYT